MGKYLDKQGVETLWNKTKALNGQKQDRTSAELDTEAKEIVPAINEAAAAAKSAQERADAVGKDVADGRKGGYMRALYEAEGAKYNEATGYYELNGLTDITEVQMAEIYNESMRVPKNSPYLAGCHAQSRARTIFKPTLTAIISSQASNGFECFTACPNLERVDVSISLTPGLDRNINRLTYTFAWCSKLKTIYGAIGIKDASPNNAFAGCSMLEEVYLYFFVGGNLSFANSPRINYTSLRYLIDYAANTAAVTVTVHATTYGYLTGTTAPTEQVGGTAEQWAQLMADATARKISFATA